MSKYNFYGHDDGLVVTQPKSGQFEERPMTAAELAAREPARKISEDIYRHANQAGVCYYEIWRLITESIDGATEPLRVHLKDLVSERNDALTKLAAQTERSEELRREIDELKRNATGASEGQVKP